MSADTSIEWTDRTWNPVRGCSRVSPGCDNCYAMRVAHRFSGPAVQDPSGDRSLDKPAGPYHGLTVLRPKTAKRPGVDWSGRVRFVPEALGEPLRWRKPQRVFVNSMSDLFHDGLEDWQIDAVFGVMWACLYLGRDALPGHVFQILTKRPKRAVDYFSKDRRREWAQHAVNHGGGIDPDGIHDQVMFHEGPHPRIWLGVSAENQATANERIPLLLRCPAAVRFVSAEPLLEQLTLTRVHERNSHTSGITVTRDALRTNALSVIDYAQGNKLDWVIVGGESGSGARPFDVDWAFSIVRQCRAAGVACFVKQVGARPVREGIVGGGIIERFALRDPKGGDMSEWPEALRVRQFPEAK